MTILCLFQPGSPPSANSYALDIVWAIAFQNVQGLSDYRENMICTIFVEMNINNSIWKHFPGGVYEDACLAIKAYWLSYI